MNHTRSYFFKLTTNAFPLITLFDTGSLRSRNRIWARKEIDCEASFASCLPSPYRYSSRVKRWMR